MPTTKEPKIKVRGTRTTELRNKYIKGKWLQRENGTWFYTSSSEPSSPRTLTPQPKSPRGFSPELETLNSPRSSRSPPRSPSRSPPLSPRSPSSSAKYNWAAPAAGAAATGMMYTTRRRYPRKKSAARRNSSPSTTMTYVSPVATLPTSTTMVYDPAQGILVGKNHPPPYSKISSSASVGGSFALLVGTFAAATLAARKKAQQKKKKTRAK